MIKISFYANEIIFNSVSCEDMGLNVFITDSNSKFTIINYKSELVKPYKQNIFLPKKQYIEEPNYLKISFYPSDGVPLERTELDEIAEWLDSNGEYKKLEIVQDDMEDLHFNCRLQSLEAETFGNLTYKLHSIFQCDSVYAWEDEKTITKTEFDAPIVFNNTSSEDKMCPTYKIYMNGNGGVAKIKDTFYSTNGEMEMANLQAFEVIIINTRLCTFTSDLRTNILENFTNLNFLRLDKGEHSFEITGNVSKFEIVYKNAKKIGGNS